MATSNNPAETNLDQKSNILEVETVDTRDETTRVENLISEKPKRRWVSYIWDSLDKSPEERRLLFKLDCVLLTLSCFGYFVKYLDQININNAFVSGMKEDLNMFGNQLNYMQTCWSVGYVLGGLPSNILLTRVRPSYFIPAIELCWTILTMCSCRATSAKQLYAIRFFVGLFESALYPGMIYIIGSWYRSDELAKRTCLFQMSSAVGTMFSGYLMAAVYHLDGKGGLKGWQWLFVVDGIISLPVALAGFFLLPDLPEITRAKYFNETDIILARRRMEVEGRAGRKPYTKDKLIQIFTSWRFWCLVPLYACWNNGGASGQPVFAQFLKDSKNPVYTVTQINTYPTTTSGLQVFTTMVFAWTSDSILKGRRWPAIYVGGAINIIVYASLWYWNIPNGWRWTCYIFMGPGAALAGIIMSWAHEICADNNEERAIVTGSMNQMAYVFQIWLPLIVWQQIHAPQYKSGFATVLFLSVAMIILTQITIWFHRREKARKGLRAESPIPETSSIEKI
ncbi:major facilitator superfamily domain-containing protein [Xylogone sp. PMI_703]|nr:major facilitator superfamily domain-containing protein [Xylogone sp. PMI_703]